MGPMAEGRGRAPPSITHFRSRGSEAGQSWYDCSGCYFSLLGQLGTSYALPWPLQG